MSTAATLQVSTPTDREIALTRVFDAPRRMVFDCLTKPELLKRWGLGPAGWSLVECDIDLRVGGTWRFVMHGTGGKVMRMSGVYREIARPERIVQTERFDEPWYPGEAINTTVLTENAGKTTLSVTLLYDSPEIRDLVLKSGIEHGVSHSYDRLAELLATLPAGDAE
jgi:uncharacterized protein YndB with AHSA1/START domain